MSTAVLNSDDSLDPLTVAALAGDHEAFGQLVSRYSGMVTGVAYAVLGDFARSEDAGQEAFLEAWRKRATLSDPRRFVAWVCSIARNRAIDAVRRSRRTTEPVATIASSPGEATTGVVAEPAESDSPVDRLASEEECALVWSTLDDLPESVRETMVLFYRSGQSTAEVAESLGQSEPTIRKRLSRGREMLRGELETLIGRTLERTAPRAAFAAAIMGGLSTSTASAATTAGIAGKAAGGTACQTVAGGWLAMFGFGPLLGLLGGLLGSGVGTYFSYRSSPYAGQRRTILAIAVASAVVLVVYLGLLTTLVGRQTSETPLPPATYTTRLVTLNFGFQAVLWLVIGLGLWHWRRQGQRAKAANEAIVDDYEAFAAFQRKLQPPRKESRQTLWGQPLWVVDFGQHADPLEGPLFKKPTVARGWVAIGNVAVGRVLAMGNVAVSPVAAVGTVAVAPLAVGAIGIGVLAVAGIAIGVMAIGGLGIGGLVAAGAAAGYYTEGGGILASHAPLAVAAERSDLVGFGARLLQLRGDALVKIAFAAIGLMVAGVVGLVAVSAVRSDDDSVADDSAAVEGGDERGNEEQNNDMPTDG